MEELTKLMAKKRVERRSLIKVQTNIESLMKGNIDTNKLNVINANLIHLASSLKEFQGLCIQIITCINSTSKKTAVEIIADEDEVMNDYDDLCLQLSRLQGEFETISNKVNGVDKSTKRRSILSVTSANAADGSSTSGIRVPKIDIPQFNGDLRKYHDWAALFENIVHSNDAFDPLQKLYYLKTALIDDAAELLVDTPLNENAYADAWAEVRRNYDNKRAIIAAHFTDLLDLKLIRNESEIRDTLRKLSATLRGLKSCNIDVGKMSPIVAFIVCSKLEPQLRKDWERSIKDNSTYPGWEQLSKFLKEISFAHEACASNTKFPTIKGDKPSDRRERKALVTSSYNNSSGSAKQEVKCPLCKSNHYLSLCEKFLAKTLMERFNTVKELRLCTNCFRSGHTVTACKSSKCRKCSKSHHTLLHRDEFTTEVKGDETKKSEDQPKAALSTFAAKGSQIILLPSAVVYVVLNSQIVKARVLLDGCAEPNLVTEAFVQKHRIPTSKSPSIIGGVTETKLKSERSARLTIKSRFNNFQFNMDADVIPVVPYKVNLDSIKSVASSTTNLPLADSSLTYEEVDIIVGVEFVNICLFDERKFFDGICLQNSQLGWIASGINAPTTQFMRYCNLITDVETQLHKFWEIEEVEPKSITLSENENCVRHFEKTVSRLPSGQFSVGLPFKRSRTEIANTYKNALFSLRRMEMKLDAETKMLYAAFMTEYRELGHMEIVPTSQHHQLPTYYLPHHCVIRPSSTTTKLRVVFNGSAKNTSGCSLNEALMVGPTIQPELFEILLSFRRYQVAFTADISKMYRCILINKDDRDMQRILWRDSCDGPVEVYRLNTVTYGTSPASFIATKCLSLLADAVREQSPEAARAIQAEFYMDDLLTGSYDLESAKRKQKLIHDALASAKLPLAKYASNSPELLQSIDSNLVEQLKVIEFANAEVISVLGLQWNPADDNLSVKIANVESPAEPTSTKRIILSLISRIFDPLGLLAPVTLYGKILLQDLWREEVTWDAEIPSHIRKSFLQYYDTLPLLRDISIPRPFEKIGAIKHQLIGFCDASLRAYCAVVYLRSINAKDQVASLIVCAKTRVAPTKAITIPRLELLGAVLLVKLINRVRNSLKIEIDNVFAFCDSTVALAWIKGPSSNYETFVRNRSAFIESKLPFPRWNYVKTIENPADLGTRGLIAHQFIENLALWQYGPTWVINDFESHLKVALELEIEVPERRKVKSVLTVNKILTNIKFIENFSSFDRCINTFAYVNRFLNKIRKLPFQDKSLTVKEREHSFNCLILLNQSFYFHKEIDSLNNKLSISNNSSLRPLNVFFDKNRILRVGGRLAASNFSYDVKHPIILHRNSYLLLLYIRYIHETFLHATKSFILSHIRRKFWVIGGVNQLVKKIVFQCVRCTRIKATTTQQFMADLPASRIQPSRPFTHTGVDFAGPFQIKCTGHRSMKFNKAYAAFFVCFVTKAVHIEIVVDLSTNAFLAALDRFVSRRGVPREMYSDNATNFVGTKNALATEIISSYAVKHAIRWNFIPPRSPHFGGLWEAAVKSGKAYLTRAIGCQVLNYDEFVTVFSKVEAILNSRPLCRVRVGDDYEPLTPSYFLVGSNLSEIPLSENGTIRLSKRYELVKSITSSFWRNWKSAYIAQLQPRYKWQDAVPNLSVGDVVILKAENTPVLEWPLAVIEAVHPDQEGRVRVVEIRTTSGNFKRSVHQLVPLPSSS